MVYTVSLPTKLAKQIEALARREGKKPEEIIERAVQEMVRNHAKNVSALEESRRMHNRIKAQMRKRNPALRKGLARREVVKEMDRLSKKVADGMPFKTWQEMQAAMRGEDQYDFLRQQYIHH